MNFILRNTANIFTLLNLFCGFSGIVNALYGDVFTASWFVIWACIFDFLDGFTARKFNLMSDIGKQLDSFSDLVSFGLLPAFILHVLLLRAHANWIETLYFTEIPAVTFIPFILPAAAAIRLARFNLDQQQTAIFKGLPTPASALVVASLPLILRYDLYIFNLESIYFKDFILNPWFLLFISLLLSFLMLSRLKLFSFKMKGWSFAENKLQYLLVALFVVMFIIFLFLAIPLIILIYIILSLIFLKTES